MSRRTSWLIVVAALAVAAPARADSPFANWEDFWGAFTSWSIDSSRIADVRSLMLERDAGTIVFEEGRLAFAKPIGGRRVAAVFVGRGTFAFAPRSEIEQQQLKRFYGTRVLRRKFERLALIFSDSTLAELQPALHFRTDTLGQLRRTWNATLPYLKVAKLRFVRPLPVTQMLLDGADNGLFWALITDKKNEDPLFFSLIPDYAERVVLERKPEGDRTGLLRRYNAEIVSSSFAVGDPDTMRRDRRPAYEARRYVIDVTLSTDLTCTAVADLDVLAYDRPRAWIGLVLPEELEVDEVSRGGKPQRYFREDENPMLWVRLDQAIQPESTATLRVRYRGRLFEREEDWAFHKFTSGWYPQPWFGADATWDMTFHYPREIQLVGSGERMEYHEDRSVHHSNWRIRRPVPWASFDVNFLRGTRIVDDSLPPLTVWMRHVDGAGRVETTSLAELRKAKDYDRRVAFDVARAFQFFSVQLGEPVAPEFNAVETPLWRYEAYPGLVHMMLREDRVLPGPEYTPDVIRAHEIAHQWFGLGVSPASYHDAWLSEGFADFCSLWYLQAGRQDAKSYFKVLDSWREKLLTNRKYVLGKGLEAGPIWLGTRANTSSTPDDYSVVIYSKGAWVLHMLRNLLLDESDPAETKFRDLMRGFYQRFKGRRAFTEEFRAEVERVTGEDMNWFFAQWVYGTGVPVCRFTWRAEPVNGQWRVRGRIETSSVPETFRFPVLLRVNFGPESFSRQRVWVNGPVTEFELPLAPTKPSEVVFNDLQSVLCEVE